MGTWKKIDLRMLNAKELYFVRKQVVRLKEKGISGAEIFELTGVMPNRASEIWTRFQRGGLAALKPKPSGSKKGERMLLTPSEEREIRKTIIDKTPDQMKMGGCLWTRQSISEYIARAHRKKLSLRCITNYLKRWGLTCQSESSQLGVKSDPTQYFVLCHDEILPYNVVDLCPAYHYKESRKRIESVILWPPVQKETVTYVAWSLAKRR